MNSYSLTNRFKYQYFILALSLNTLYLGTIAYLTRNIVCLLIFFLGLEIVSIFTMFYKVRNEHIVISEKGIEYYSPWLMMETRWEGIEKISYYWHHGLRNESLLIDNSKIRIKKWSFLDRGPSTPLEGFPQKTIIPLSCFSENWRDSELGQQIKQYAPHLFQ